VGGGEIPQAVQPIVSAVLHQESIVLVFIQ